MAKTVITTTSNYIKAVFGDDAQIIGYAEKHKPLSSISEVALHSASSRKGTYVELHFSDGSKWTFDEEGARGMVVDSINGGSKPSSNKNLATSLAELIL